jgi:anti-sigma-K factor RskA
MTEPELHDRLEELMAGYALNNLSREEAEEVRQLLKQHPELTAKIDQLQEVLELMPYALPEVTTPPHLRETILQAANTKVNINPAQKQKHIFTWNRIAVAIASLLLLALALDDYHTKQQLHTLQAQVIRQKDVIAMLQNPNTHLVSLKGMDMASAASGSVVMTPGEPKVILVLQNLPILPKGQSYQLWSVVDGEKIPSGKFDPSSQGSVFVKLSLPPDTKVTALLVTIEKSPSPDTPTGPMVMTSSL